MLLKEIRLTETAGQQELPLITVILVEHIKIITRFHLTVVTTEVVPERAPTGVVFQGPPGIRSLLQEVAATTKVPETAPITEVQETQEVAIEVPQAVLPDHLVILEVPVALPDLQVVLLEEAVAVAVAVVVAVAVAEATKFSLKQMSI